MTTAQRLAEFQALASQGFLTPDAEWLVDLAVRWAPVVEASKELRPRLGYNRVYTGSGDRTPEPHEFQGQMTFDPDALLRWQSAVDRLEGAEGESE